MSEPKVPSPTAHLAFAIACALCGLFTAYNSAFDPSVYWPYYRGVLPFCVLLAAVCVRPFPLVPIAVIGGLLSWRLAFFTMSAMGALTDDSSLLTRLLYWAAPGLIGALGLAASAGLGARIIYEPKRFLVIGFIGMLAATLFAAGSSIGLYAGFAIWQTAVGLAIFHFAKMPNPSPDKQ